MADRITDLAWNLGLDANKMIFWAGMHDKRRAALGELDRGHWVQARELFGELAATFTAEGMPCNARRCERLANQCGGAV